jgi:carboxypeptidase family protein/BACON domain-containing protein
VMVTLTVQKPPAPGAPVMSAAPLNLNFSSTSGQPNPKGQVVTITNTGASALYWSTTATQIGPTWLSASPTGSGAVPVAPGQSEQLVVNINTSQLSPGTYAGQIGLFGRDSHGNPASGSGQVVSINLVVQPACTLTQPSSSALAFSSVQGPYDPISQTVLITGTGNCAWPLTWTATSSAPWLVIQPPSNSIKASGQSSSFSVQPDPAGKMLAAGVYTTSITISATDSAGTVATGGPQTISVTLTVSPPPCLPVVAPALAFTAAQGQASPTQSVPLSESGGCSRPVSWTAGTSSAWLTLSSPPPDTGSGSLLTVTVNSAGLQAGTDTGTITVSATDGNGNAVGAPQTITVTLTVTPTYSVSGTVFACQPGCISSAPLPGATIAVFNTNGLVETVTADASGNYIIPNLSPDSYTVNISGTDANNVSYSTTGIPLPVVSSNTTGIALDVFPG